MRYKDEFPSQWLTADDIDCELVVTIRRYDPIEHREFKAQGKATPDNKPVLFFEAPKGTKPLILNKTNWKAIDKVLGTEDTDDWAGQSLTLYTTEVEVGGETMLGIRVRVQKPKPAPKVTKSAPSSQPQSQNVESDDPDLL
jgi:hypothetical protein